MAKASKKSPEEKLRVVLSVLRGELSVAVARTFKVSWATAWREIAAAARAKIALLSKRPPRRLGIDETTFGRHRSFMTGLVDLDTSRLWDLIEGRSKKVLVARLEALGEGVRCIEAVVIDPYAGYKAAVRDLAPHATRVADRFHIERLAAQALTEVRCRRQQETWSHRGRRGDPLWGRGGTCCGPGNISPTPPTGASTRRSEPIGGTNSNAPGRSRRCSATSTPAPTGTPPRRR